MVALPAVVLVWFDVDEAGSVFEHAASTMAAARASVFVGEGFMARILAGASPCRQPERKDATPPSVEALPLMKASFIAWFGALALVIMGFGAGRVSVDALIERRLLVRSLGATGTR